MNRTPEQWASLLNKPIVQDYPLIVEAIQDLVELQKETRVNLNDVVSVKLTEEGRKFAATFTQEPLIPDEEGYVSRWQFWYFMLKFGNQCVYGNTNLFDFNVKIIKPK